MFTISKTEAAPAEQRAKQKQEVHSFVFDNVLRQAASEDYRHTSVEERLRERGYHLLPGGSDVLSTYEAGGETGGELFIIVAHLGHQTFVIGVPSVPHYRTFMREWGCSIAVFPHVALREQPKPQPSVVTMDLRRGY